MTEKIYAIIPARGGSKGVPDKNVKLLNGIPLLAFSIAAAKKCPLIDRVIVSTDSEKIADIAKDFGAEAPFLRPSEIAQDFSSDLEFMVHAANFFKTNEGDVPLFFVHLRPTTPLRHPTLINQAISLMKSQPSSTSLRSAHEASESPFKWFSEGGNSYWKPIVDSMTLDDCNLPRQKFPKVFVPNGYVDIVRPDYFLTHSHLHGPNISMFVTPTALEIDTSDDFHRLEYEIQATEFPLLHDLQKFKGNSKC